MSGVKPERQARDRIDDQLTAAGWAVGSRKLVQEFLVAPSVLRDSGDDYRVSNEFADYALLDRFERPIAIVEAKRSNRDPIVGERQAADYADYFNTLSSDFTRQAEKSAAGLTSSEVNQDIVTRRDGFHDERGSTPSSLLHAGVCEAILDPNPRSWWNCPAPIA